MTYKTLDSVNTTEGIHTLFIYVNDVTSGIFSRLILFSFFIILMFGSYFSQKRLTGKADLPSSFAIAGFVSSGLAILMTFIDGLITTFDVVVVVSVTMLGVLWLFMSKRSDLE